MVPIGRGAVNDAVGPRGEKIAENAENAGKCDYAENEGKCEKMRTAFLPPLAIGCLYLGCAELFLS